MTCPLHPAGGAYGCQHCNQPRAPHQPSEVSVLTGALAIALKDAEALRAELAALKAARAQELRAVAERQREATTASCVGAVRHSQQTTDQCRAEVGAAGRATPLVTEEK